MSILFGKSGIHIKKKNEGKFTSYCGGKVTDACIAKAKASGNPTLVKRAVFAQNARKWKHKDGGTLHYLAGGALWKRNSNGLWEALSDASGVKKGTIATQGTIGKDRKGNWNIFMNGKWVTDGGKFTNSDGSISTWNSALRKFIRTDGNPNVKWNNKTNSYGDNVYRVTIAHKELSPEQIKFVQKIIGVPLDGKYGLLTRLKVKDYMGERNSFNTRFNTLKGKFLWSPSGQLLAVTEYYNSLPRSIKNSDIIDSNFNAKNPYFTLRNGNTYYQITPDKNFNKFYTVDSLGKIYSNNNAVVGYSDGKNYYIDAAPASWDGRLKIYRFVYNK